MDSNKSDASTNLKGHPNALIFNKDDDNSSTNEMYEITKNLRQERSEMMMSQSYGVKPVASLLFR